MQNHQEPTSTLSIRVSPEMKQQLTDLAGATGRTKSFIAMKVLEQYLERHVWQVRDIQHAVTKADQPNAKFVEHDDVANWLM